MELLKRIFLFAMAVATLSLTACVNVQPSDRQYLANPYMALDPDPLKSKLRQHIYFSKEAASGGYGLGGGGCGCN